MKCGGDNMPPSNIPLKIRLTLQQGSVYYFQHRDLTSSLPHYFVVINPDPLSDELLVLGVFSSQVEATKQRRRNLPQETLVEISPSEFSELSKNSIVDCNSPRTILLEQLVEKISCKDAKDSFLRLPGELSEKILKGMLASPLVEGRIKKLLREEE